MTYIGIDTGVNTGIAVWDSTTGQFISIETCTATKAMLKVLEIHRSFEGVKVRIEDARKRKYFGRSGREKLQGAGSVKRDAKLWEDFCMENGIDYEMVAPRDSVTKMPDSVFRKAAKWDKRTSEHARDAACLVLGL